jgi:hypothetical protein
MGSTLVESFELLVYAEQLAPRLEAAAVAQAQLPELEEEKRWLAAARARLGAVRAESHGDLLNRALRLPELEGLKGERGRLIQGAIADEVERLQAGIAYAGGARSPLLDVLFHNLKVPGLRRCSRPELERFCAEIERRLASSHARRMEASVGPVRGPGSTTGHGIGNRSGPARDLQPAHHGGPGEEHVEHARDVAEVVEPDERARDVEADEVAHPRERGDVGDHHHTKPPAPRP